MLLLLGFEITEPTVSRYLQGLKRFPQERKAKQWLTFLNNHREVIAAFDFFTVRTTPIRTSVRSPWQNGIAERWVGSARRELLDHIIPLDEHNLRRLGRDYLGYYHDDGTHIGLNKATPTNRAIEQRSIRSTHISSAARIDGLHHRYGWSEAAWLCLISTPHTRTPRSRAIESRSNWNQPKRTGQISAVYLIAVVGSTAQIQF